MIAGWWQQPLKVKLADSGIARLVAAALPESCEQTLWYGQVPAGQCGKESASLGIFYWRKKIIWRMRADRRRGEILLFIPDVSYYFLALPLEQQKSYWDLISQRPLTSGLGVEPAEQALRGKMLSLVSHMSKVSRLHFFKILVLTCYS